tara:strand:+ start:2343 stop:2864 length:522 start_codon:yes stop_codon:yes gene_type:complete
MKILKIYTDGRYIPKVKSGATSFIALEVSSEGNRVLTESAKFYEMSKSETEDTYYNTNHKMEIQAILNALNWLRSKGYSKSHRIYVYTDSQNIQLATADWIRKWKKRNWKTAANTAVKNKDMWVKLDKMSNEFTSLFIQWVQGHNGDPWNERADALCKTIMEKQLGHEINIKI